MIGGQGAKVLWTKQASKKRKPAESEFPSLAGFLFQRKLKRRLLCQEDE